MILLPRLSTLYQLIKTQAEISTISACGAERRVKLQKLTVLTTLEKLLKTLEFLQSSLLNRLDSSLLSILNEERKKLLAKRNNIVHQLGGTLKLSDCPSHFRKNF
jgi:hypothetical protein